MAYRDTLVTCANCGKEFIFRVEDQRRQAERGEEITPLDLCPACRPGSTVERRSEPERRPRPEPRAEKKVDETVALGPGPHEGSVKWFDGDKGYGFIAHPDGPEIFFHRSGIAPGEGEDFPDGAPVTFLIEQTEKGPQAVDVARMDEEAEEDEE